MENYTALFMMILPGDRLSYYKTSDVAEMRYNIFKVTNAIG